MAYLVKADLYSHIYQTDMNQITQNDDTKVTAAIAAAVAEAQSYLDRYDRIGLFGTDTVAPTVTDVNLQTKVKDLAAWHLVVVCNVNISLDLYENRYKSAIRWFEKVQKGEANPMGWPVYDSSADAAPIGNNAYANYFPKRDNFY